jgi:hypothetical protein
MILGLFNNTFFACTKYDENMITYYGTHRRMLKQAVLVYCFHVRLEELRSTKYVNHDKWFAFQDYNSINQNINRLGWLTWKSHSSELDLILETIDHSISYKGAYLAV